MRRKTGEKEKENEKKVVCIRSEGVFIRRKTDKIQIKANLEHHYGGFPIERCFKTVWCYAESRLIFLPFCNC